MRAPVQVFPDLEALSDAAANSLAERVSRIVEQRGRISIALEGGETPKALYERLAIRFANTLPWSKVHVFWGDERYVSHDDPRSNYRMARLALLDHIEIPSANTHPMPTHFSEPEEAAREYEQTLRDYFGDDQPIFDLMLLGMGTDGHTASLFPGTPALNEKTRWVVPVRAAVDPPVRLTLTMPVILQATVIQFLIAGRDKAAILRDIICDEDAARKYPAGMVLNASEPEVLCWTDEAAANSICP